MNLTSQESASTLSMEEMLRYPMYYRRAGVRMPMQLMLPTLNSVSELELPMGSILHYLPDDESMYGIPQDDPILRNVERLIMVEHITTLADTRGNPIPIKLPPGQMMRQYHRKYRRTRPLLNFQSANGNPRTLIVENYSLLPHLSRYLNNYFKPFNKWWNLQATVWHRMGELARQSDRQQFLQCRLPRVLPTLPQLRRAEAGLTRQSLVPFNTPESMFLMQMWIWLGEKQTESVFTRCPPEAMQRVNLIFQEGDRWILFNMGKLLEWRKTEENKNGVIDPVNFQRRFLRMLMILMDIRLADVSDPESPTTSVPDQKTGTVDLSAPVKLPEMKDEGTVFSEPTPTLAPSEQPIKVKIQTDDGKTKSVTVLKGTTKDVLTDDMQNSDIDLADVDRQIEKDLEALSVIYDKFERAAEEGRIREAEIMNEVAGEMAPKVEYSPTPRSLEAGVTDRVNELADGGLMSAGEYRRFMAMAEAYKKLPNPYGNGETLAEAIKIDPKLLQIKTESVDNRPKIADIPTVIDKSMLGDSLKAFDQTYIKEVLPKDILAMVVNVQQAGIAVTNYQVETSEDAMTKMETHTVQLTPVQGKSSTISFMIPKVDTDGRLYVNGSTAILRKQRGDLPIRKVAFNKVALTSYYAKIYVSRSEKQVNNYAGWLTNKIAAIGMDGNGPIQHLMLANVFDSTVRVPSTYSTMAMRFRSFQIFQYSFLFDYHAREAVYGKERVANEEKNGMLVCGAAGPDLLVMDNAGTLYLADQKTDDVKPIGTFESLLGFDEEDRIPMEMIEVKVFSKLIPIGIILAYKLGFTALLKLLKAQYRVVNVGERVNLQSNEFAIRFENETYVFNRDNKLAMLVLSGFTGFEGFTRNYSSHLFDRQDIYLNLLESANLGIRYLREIDLMTDLFIDPITREILEDMQEPTTFIGLLLRASELLLTDWSPAETDMAFMRIKGYERIPGLIYGELAKSIRVLKSRGGIANAKIDLHPYAVWQAITQDSSVKLVEDSNPVNNVKEKEEVTYTGQGGRSDRSMVGRTRLFHENDLGVISEASKDSAQVAVTTYLSANPNFRTVRGVTNRFDESKDGVASLLSSSVLMAPAADRDDTKRSGFVSIQQSSGTFAKGYRPLPIRTGYEQVLASRTDDLFAAVAKSKGKVVAVNERSITVSLENGDTQVVQLGRRYGTVAALTLPHQLETHLKPGDEVEEGQVLAFNSRYFELDPLNKNRTVVWKAGCLLNVALLESADTLEDSCAISAKAAELSETETTEIRQLVVDFKDTIHGLVDPGTEVDVEDILCTIEDPVTAQSNMFDESSLDTLRLLAANTPRAKVKGVVEKIEVFYHGDIDDLSPSLMELAQESDRARKRLARDLKINYTSGRVNGALSIDGRNLSPDQAVIRVYITSKRAAQTGD